MVIFGVIFWAAWYVFDNASRNLESLGMKTGFDFMSSSAGFDTEFKLINYSAGDSYARLFFVGVANTLIVSAIAILAATILGLIVGIARLSSNWLVAKLSSAYVELLRNTPLLMQLIFWYIGVFGHLPPPKQSIDVFGLGIAFVNNRGLYSPAPQELELLGAFILPIVGSVAALIIWHRLNIRRRDASGREIHGYRPVRIVIWGVFVLTVLLCAQSIHWELPALQGFNYQGGVHIPPTFLCLFVGLAVYHSSYVAEIVRAGIQSVPHGQTEAGYVVGLNRRQLLRLIVIPQAMRAIVPPLISVWMDTVKNSSLAVAVGYPDIVSLFMKTALHQTGRAIEIVALIMIFYMVISLSISAALNIYNRRIQIRER